MRKLPQRMKRDDGELRTLVFISSNVFPSGRTEVKWKLFHGTRCTWGRHTECGKPVNLVNTCDQAPSIRVHIKRRRTRLTKMRLSSTNCSTLTFNIRHFNQLSALLSHTCSYDGNVLVRKRFRIRTSILGAYVGMRRRKPSIWAKLTYWNNCIHG